MTSDEKSIALTIASLHPKRKIGPRYYPKSVRVHGNSTAEETRNSSILVVAVQTNEENIPLPKMNTKR